MDTTTEHKHELVPCTKGFVSAEFGYDDIEDFEICIICGKTFPEKVENEDIPF